MTGPGARPAPRCRRGLSAGLSAGLAAALAALAGCGREAPTVGPAEAPATPRGSPPPATARHAPAESGPGMARLRSAVAGAPINPMVTRADRLAAAREFAASRPGDRTPRQRELQAQLIVIVGSVLDNEPASLARMLGVNEFPLFGLYARDVDGDGVLTEDEASASSDAIADLQNEIWDFYPEIADADGDGAITAGERDAAFDGVNSGMEPLMTGMMDRAALAAWDTDRDGRLSEAEREAGVAAAPGSESDDVWARASAMSGVVDPLREAMLLTPFGDHDAARAELGPPPEYPRPADFDLDGDGSVSGIEQEAFASASAAHNTARRAHSRRAEASSTLADWRAAAARLDADADGAVSPGEWEAGFERLRAERDRRVFEFFYDLDRDGSVSDAEVLVFMNAYEAGLPFADADLDGRVGPADLHRFLDRVSGQ